MHLFDRPSVTPTVFVVKLSCETLNKSRYYTYNTSDSDQFTYGIIPFTEGIQLGLGIPLILILLHFPRSQHDTHSIHPKNDRESPIHTHRPRCCVPGCHEKLLPDIAQHLIQCTLYHHDCVVFKLTPTTNPGSSVVSSPSTRDWNPSAFVQPPDMIIEAASSF